MRCQVIQNLRRPDIHEEASHRVLHSRLIDEASLPSSERGSKERRRRFGSLVVWCVGVQAIKQPSGVYADPDCADAADLIRDRRSFPRLMSSVPDASDPSTIGETAPITPRSAVEHEQAQRDRIAR